MFWNNPSISGTHKAQLISDAIHAGVASVVVGCTTVVTVVALMHNQQTAVVISFTSSVFVGVIGYVAGRSGTVRQSAEDEAKMVQAAKAKDDSQIT